MAYRVLADLILVLHFCFVIFVVLGGLLVVRRQRIAWLHIPALIWGILVECFLWACPLTTLENTLRHLSGEAGYQDGFINYYISAILYAEISPQFRFMLGLLLIGFNLLVYSYIVQRRFFPRDGNNRLR